MVVEMIVSDCADYTEWSTFLTRKGGDVDSILVNKVKKTSAFFFHFIYKFSRILWAIGEDKKKNGKIMI